MVCVHGLCVYIGYVCGMFLFMNGICARVYRMYIL